MSIHRSEYKEVKNSIAFIVKTDINTDGRVLNELRILQAYLEGVDIDLILLPDKLVNVDLGERVRLHVINCSVRNSRWLRMFTVIEFLFKALVLLFKINPAVVHAQDSAVVLPVLLFQVFNRKNTVILYDDHEIPNENRGIWNRMYGIFENRLLKSADAVLFANKERMDLMCDRLKLTNETSFLLNLPYYQMQPTSSENLFNRYRDKLKKIDDQIDNGVKFIIHQGVITDQRGRDKLAEFSRILPSDYKIMLLGGNTIGFDKFVGEYRISREAFYFIGTVNYDILPEFWKRGIGSIVLYLPKYINNRFCAPNRLYLSIEKNLPVIVNKDNPVLSNFVKKYNCGFFIENFDKGTFLNLEGFSRLDLKETYNKLRKEEVESFLSFYRRIFPNRSAWSTNNNRP